MIICHDSFDSPPSMRPDGYIVCDVCGGDAYKPRKNIGTFNEFLTYVSLNFNDNPKMRPGQQLFNMLSKVNSNLANMLVFHDQDENDSSKHVDPFYRDENITRFWAYVGEHWDD